jgi:hypothetical protein
MLPDRTRSQNTKSKSSGIFRTLPVALIKAERADAIRFNKPLDGIAGAAYTYFFRKLNAAQRAELYRAVPDKIRGRSVK